MDYKIEHFEKYIDKRGQLNVFLKESQLNKKNKKFGQIYFVTFEGKGIIRGNHYHKRWREWFGVVIGKVEVRLKNRKTKETAKFYLYGGSKEYLRLEIGPNIVHAFKSISPYAALLNYANKEWSADDVFCEELIKTNNETE